MADFRPTAEQERALDLYRTGESVAIAALAGAGKTSTLELLALDDTSRTAQFLAFNRAITDAAARKMPRNVSCKTAHGLAMRAVGHRFAHRLNSNRMRAADIAKALRIDPIFIVVDGSMQRKAPGWSAGLVMRALTKFCQSADPEPTMDHFPYVDGVDDRETRLRADGSAFTVRGWANNREIRRALLPALKAAWVDACDPNGKLRYAHDFYLKLWERSNPHINTDVIFVDECQDLSPVLISIVEQQDAQRVLVGDANQAIYGFTGAVSAFDRIDVPHRTQLTKSWRFGDEIAAVANEILDRLDANLRIVGNSVLDGYVGLCERPDIILCRTNATAVREILTAQKAGMKAHLIGGGKDVLSFAKAVLQLQADGWTSHPELSCFTSWPQVVDYVEQDEQGGELRLLVDLVGEFGATDIVDGLGAMASAEDAERFVSTGHKTKGLEFGSVKLAEDFPGPDKLNSGSSAAVDELRLLYVAVTRAKTSLDVTACPSFEETPAVPVPA